MYIPSTSPTIPFTWLDLLCPAGSYLQGISTTTGKICIPLLTNTTCPSGVKFLTNASGTISSTCCQSCNDAIVANGINTANYCIDQVVTSTDCGVTCYGTATKVPYTVSYDNCKYIGQDSNNNPICKKNAKDITCSKILNGMPCCANATGTSTEPTDCATQDWNRSIPICPYTTNQSLQITVSGTVTCPAGACCGGNTSPNTVTCGGSHTTSDCTTSGGTQVSYNNVNYCQFNSSSCPTAGNWSEAYNKTSSTHACGSGSCECIGACTSCSSGPSCCTTGSHSTWGTVVESCSYSSSKWTRQCL
ncbi:MAG: hypothetical protein HQK53_08630 [Oligoflexia bacterium]|nr:hypothetical protein [Oligoflexia bacterium]